MAIQNTAMRGNPVGLVGGQQPQQRPMLPIPDPTTYEGNFAEPF